MKEEAMLREMIRECLGKADLKAIARSRGFTEENMASPELLEHAFLSGLGLEKAVTTLEPREVLLLHVLQCLGREVGIEFFERVYGLDLEDGQERSWLSFNDRYRPVRNRVQSNLVRKGLLIVAEEKALLFPRNCLLERLRFLFPAGFGPFLPPPFLPVRLEGNAPGERRDEFPRRKLQEVFDQAEGPPGGKDERHRLRIEGGELLLGEKPFSAKRLLEWRDREWEAACPVKVKRRGKSPAPVSLVGCTLHALSRLGEDEAATPLDLVPLWTLALPGAELPQAESFCEAGWQRGALEKVAVAAGKTCYRLPRAATAPSTAPPEDCLDPRDPAAVAVDLGKIPFQDLERLAGLTRFEIRGGRLLAQPSFLKLSRASEEVLREHPLPWLREHHRGFREVLQRIGQRMGKVFVHQNLLIARIRDLALKVMIERRLSALPGERRVVSFSDGFIAFPQELLREVAPLVRKAGHALKTVRSDG